LEELLKALKENFEVYGSKENFLSYKDPIYIYTDFDYGGFNLYFELKPYDKDIYHTMAVNNKIKVKKEDLEFFFSPIELQIVYKLFLGSDKDILDAKYVYELFKEYIDEKELKKLAIMLNVEDLLDKIIIF